MKYKIAIFDLDGTLSDPARGLVEGFVYAFRKMGVEYESREALKNYATHPAHLAAKEHFWNFLDTRVCADYDL